MAHDEEWFWSVVEAAAGSRATLKTRLESATREELISFDHHFTSLQDELTWSDPTGDRGEHSEDELADVAGWVVSQGRDAYQAAMDDPGSVPFDVTEKIGWVEGTLAGVADTLFWERYREELPWPEETG